MRPRRSASSHSVGPHPVVAARRRVAFVEDEVDDLEHRRQPRGQLGAARHLERHARLGQRPLGAHDPLRDRRLGDEEGARDLVGREAAEQPQRQRHARLGREHGMTGDEHEPQQIVADVVVERGLDVGRRRRRARRRARRACARACAGGAAGRWRGSSPSPSATRRDCRGCPSPASARAPSPAPLAPDPRPARRRERGERARRSGARTRFARPPRWPCAWPPRHRLARAASAAYDCFCRSISARSCSPRARSSGVSRVAEVLGLEHRANGHLDATVEGRALDPLDRLLHRLHLPDPVAGDELLGLGERPVDDRALRAREAHALGLATSACSPSPSSMTPALTSSSLNFIISRSAPLASAARPPRSSCRRYTHHHSHVLLLSFAWSLRTFATAAATGPCPGRTSAAPRIRPRTRANACGAAP